MKRSDNHKLAPICAAWVKEMREVFGEDVKVLYVKEGDFEMGEPVLDNGRDERIGNEMVGQS
jgi:hypothetical protein